jgi:flagellar basal body-associated protein FliL
MKRIEKYKNERNKSYWISVTIVLGILFVVAFSVTTSILILKENNQVRDFILNYDKTKQVYNLQQDFLGGNLNDNN